MISLKDLLRFVVKRIVGSAGALFGVVIIVFLVSHVLTPNPAALWAGPRARPSTVAAVAARYHLNEPITVQFYYFLVDLFSGNFGIDPLTGQTIISEIAFYLPNTLELVLAAMVIVIILGVVLGYYSAMNFSRPLDSTIRVFYLLSWSTPNFLGAIVAILAFSTYLHIFPSGGMYSLTLQPPTRITGIFILDSLITGQIPQFLSGVYYLILPATALAILDFGLITRVARSSILNTRWSPHVKAARARGVPEGDVRVKHILRNSLIDTNTMVAVMFGWILGDTVVIEALFAWPGMGEFAYQAILANNYPAIVPVVLVYTAAVIVANFAADVLYSILDPRIALGESK
jgi:ABC-type dipeptide/oligopeptide/nickel transport system permease component